jgi:hypothetical protein
MEEYRQQKMPAVTSVIEHQDVVMDAWQMIVADFDAEMADAKIPPNKVLKRNIPYTSWVHYLLGLWLTLLDSGR